MSVASGAGFSGIGNTVNRPSSLAGSRPSKHNSGRAGISGVDPQGSRFTGGIIGFQESARDVHLDGPELAHRGCRDLDFEVDAVPLECWAPACSDAEPAPIGGRVSGLDPGPNHFDLRKRSTREYAGIAAAGHGEPLKCQNRAVQQVSRSQTRPFRVHVQSPKWPPQGIVNPEAVFRHIHCDTLMARFPGLECQKPRRPASLRDDGAGTEKRPYKRSRRFGQPERRERVLHHG